MEKTVTEEERRRLEIPDRRKNTYAALEAKVHEYFDAVEARLNRFFAKALFIFATISITSAIALLGFGILLGDQRDTNDKLEREVQTNRRLGLAIQDQRRNLISDSCKEQNDRNRNTKNALRIQAAIDERNAPPEARAEIRRRRDVTFLLIDALVPVKNCQQEVKDGLKTG
jgi:hypothetical protein